MNEILMMVAVFIAGIGLGTIFFGGLWFSTKKALHAKMPAIWVLGSFVIRVGVVLLGFYVVANGNWKNMLFCLLGFIVARVIVIRVTKTIDAKQLQLNKNNNHGA